MFWVKLKILHKLRLQYSCEVEIINCVVFLKIVAHVPVAITIVIPSALGIYNNEAITVHEIVKL